MSKTIEEQREEDIKVLDLLVMSQMMVERIDALKGTKWWNANVKKHSNILSNVLNPMLIKHFTNLYNEDPEIITNFFRELNVLLEKIGGVNIVDIAMLNQIHDHYSKNKEDWQNLFDLEFKQLNT